MPSQRRVTSGAATARSAPVYGGHVVGRSRWYSCIVSRRTRIETIFAIAAIREYHRGYAVWPGAGQLQQAVPAANVSPASLARRVTADA